MRKLKLASLAAVVALLSGQAAFPSLPAPERLESLLGRPDARVYEASRLRMEDGSSWIRSVVEVEAVFPGTIGEFLAVATDYENGPKTYSRVASVRIRSREGKSSITEQSSVVKALGFRFESNLVFRNTIESVSGQGAHTTFKMLETDGSARDDEGGWYYMATWVRGQPAVYILYYNDLIVAQRFPLQLQIMQTFGRADYEKVLRELAAAVQARR